MKSTLSNPTSQLSIMKSSGNQNVRNISYGGSGGYSNTNTTRYSCTYYGTKDNSLANQVSAQLRQTYKRK